MQETVQASRLGGLTSLLAALHHDAARLFVAEHVLVEVERDLPGYAEGRGADPVQALTWWKHYYLPYIRVVNVPANWGASDPRVQGVADRHRTDLPTAQLAAALAPCHGLIEDADLADHGFGHQRRQAKQSQSDWLKLAHGSANQAQMELVGSVAMVPTMLSLELAQGAGRTFRRLPGWAQAALVVAGVAGGVAWHRSERAKDQLTRFGSAVRDAGKAVWPLAQVVLEREAEAQRVWSENAVEAGPVALSEKVARTLSLAGAPMTAAELAREIQAGESLRSTEAAVRDELRNSSAFHEVSRGGWELGRMASNQEPGVVTAQVTDWVQRSHRRKTKAPGSLDPAHRSERSE